MTALGTLKPELMAALEAIDQQSPVDFWDAETLVDTGLAAFNPGNDYWYELTSTGELQLNKYAAWDELRAERDAALERIKVLENVLLEALAYARTGLIPVEFEPYVFDGETRRLHWNEHMRMQIAKLIDAAIK